MTVRVPAAAQWATAAEAGRPPEKLFDFPDLRAGLRFEPAPGAYIAVRWLPRTFPWRATARIEEAEPQALAWTEENRIAGLAFSARVRFERTGPYAARLRIEPSLAGWRGPRVTQDYEIVAADRNVVALRAAGQPADMVCFGRQVGTVMQFHLRLPLGVAIHKSGDLVDAAGAGAERRSVPWNA